MSLLGRPIIFLPGAGEWDSCRRRRVAGMPRRNFRRRPYPTPVSRHPLEELFSVDPFEDIFVEDYPGESSYEMREVPRYISLEPRRVYVYKTKNDLDSKKPKGEMVKKTRHVPQARKANDIGSEKQMNGKNAKSVLMDLDQLVSELVNSFYGVGNRSRSQQKPSDPSAKKDQDQVGEKKTQVKPNEKMSETQPATDTEPIKDANDSNIKTKEVETSNSEANKTEDHTTSTERNTVVNQDVEGKDEPRTDDIEVVFVIDNNTPKEDEDVGNNSLMDTQEDATEMEPEDARQNTADTDSASQEVNSVEVQEKDDAETSHLAEVHEPMEGRVLEKHQSMEVEHQGKFQMDIDLSSFLPEEIQVKLSDDKLILDAVHEVVREGMIEKHSIQKVLSLPPSVDPDSLRCRLGEDGHMTISANHVEKSKSKILTIEKHMD